MNDDAQRYSKPSASMKALAAVTGAVAAIVPYCAPIATIVVHMVRTVQHRRVRCRLDHARRDEGGLETSWVLPWWAWLLGAAAWLIGPTLRGDAPGMARAAFEYGVLWCLLGSSACRIAPRPVHRALADGALLALIAMAAVSVYQAVANGLLPAVTRDIVMPQLPFGPHPLAYPGRVAGWLDHPNLWGVWAVLLGVGVVVLRAHRLVMLSALGLTMIIVVASGSRSALFALFVAMVFIAWFSRSRTQALRMLFIIATPLIAGWVFLSPFGARFDVSSLQFLLSTTEDNAHANLFLSSEDVLDDRSAWLRFGVSVVPGERVAEIEGDDGSSGPIPQVRRTPTSSTPQPSIVTLIKDTDAPDARIYQAVTLHPDTVYTLSAELRPDTSEQRPGLAGWGRRDEASDHDVVNAVIADGALRTSSAGSLAVQSSDVRVGEDGWLAARVTFSYEGSQALTWRVGPTVDQRPSTASIGSQLGVRKLQLSVGDETTAYAPTTLRQRQQRVGVEALAARVDIYRVAIRAIGERPMAGWGDVPLAEVASPGSATRAASVDHAHNVVLDAVVRHGALGLLGVAVVCIALWRAALRVGWEAVALFATLLAVNMADSLFWSLGIVHLCATFIHVGVMDRGNDTDSPGRAVSEETRDTCAS